MTTDANRQRNYRRLKSLLAAALAERDVEHGVEFNPSHWTSEARDLLEVLDDGRQRRLR